MGMKIQEKEETNRKKIYDFIVAYITQNGYSPSIREIAKGTDLHSTSSIYNHLHLLETMGKIKMEPNKIRTIQVTGYKLVKVEENCYER